MIRLQGLTVGVGRECVQELNLTVQNGEIFCLLSKERALLDRLFGVLRGFIAPSRGEVLYFGDSAPSGRNCVFVPFVNPMDFAYEATLNAYLSFYSRVSRLKKESVFENLIKLNIGEADLKKRVRDVDRELFKKLILAVLLASPATNLVINDFIYGEKKAFELDFNKLLARKRDENRAILYLTDNIFYALHIADRVGFIKRGHLLPREPISAIDLEDMDLMRLYRKYLS